MTVGQIFDDLHPGNSKWYMMKHESWLLDLDILVRLLGPSLSKIRRKKNSGHHFLQLAVFVFTFWQLKQSKRWLGLLVLVKGREDAQTFWLFICFGMTILRHCFGSKKCTCHRMLLEMRICSKKEGANGSTKSPHIEAGHPQPTQLQLSSAPRPKKSTFHLPASYRSTCHLSVSTQHGW